MKKLCIVIIALLTLFFTLKASSEVPFRSIFNDYTILGTHIKKEKDNVFIKYKVKGVLPIGGVSQVGIMEVNLVTKCSSMFASITTQDYYKLNGSLIRTDEINEEFLISKPEDRKIIKYLCNN